MSPTTRPGAPLDALYRSASMESAARGVTIAGGTRLVFLRAVETRPGSAEGKLTLAPRGRES